MYDIVKCYTHIPLLPTWEMKVIGKKYAYLSATVSED